MTKISAETIVQSWMEKGDHDIAAAEIILKSSEPLTDIVCYHCHQAVEKYLKAYLIHKKVSFPKTHDLDYLIELCVKEELAFHNIKNDVKGLSEYSIETRYPGDIPISYDVEEAEEALKKVKKITKFVKEFI